jgi:hypothetical protein
MKPCDGFADGDKLLCLTINTPECRAKAGWIADASPKTANNAKWAMLALVAVCTIGIGSWAWIRARVRRYNILPQHRLVDVGAALAALIVQAICAATVMMCVMHIYYCMECPQWENWSWDLGTYTTLLIFCIMPAVMDTAFLMTNLMLELRLGEGDKLYTLFSFLFVLTVAGTALSPLWMPFAVPWAYRRLRKVIDRGTEDRAAQKKDRDIELGNIKRSRKPSKATTSTEDMPEDDDAKSVDHNDNDSPPQSPFADPPHSDQDSEGSRVDEENGSEPGDHDDEEDQRSNDEVDNDAASAGMITVRQKTSLSTTALSITPLRKAALRTATAKRMARVITKMPKTTPAQSTRRTKAKGTMRAIMEVPKTTPAQWARRTKKPKTKAPLGTTTTTTAAAAITLQTTSRLTSRKKPRLLMTRWTTADHATCLPLFLLKSEFQKFLQVLCWDSVCLRLVQG